MYVGGFDSPLFDETSVEDDLVTEGLFSSSGM